MTRTPIRLGVIGVNAERGWGSAVHLPVIASLSDFELVAVAASNQPSAEASAARFGARLAFGDGAALAASPELDAVAICVKAPDHHPLAMAALDAGKAVYCEWPLAADGAQAQAMLALANAKGLATTVGFQARAAPAVARARQLVANGFVGRVLAVNMLVSVPGGGARRSREGLYVVDRRNGATPLSIHGGHALDVMRFVAGDFAELSATVAVQFPQTTVIETGETVEKTAPDQVLVSGVLACGAVAQAHINGGAVAGLGVLLTIYGEQGVLRITGDTAHNFQMAPLALSGARAPDRDLRPLDIPAAYDERDFAGLAGEALRPYPGVEAPPATLANIRRLYVAFAQAVRGEGPPICDFADGVRMHALLDAIQAASDTGVRQILTEGSGPA